jgi:hypothetical protein
MITPQQYKATVESHYEEILRTVEHHIDARLGCGHTKVWQFKWETPYYFKCKDVFLRRAIMNAVLQKYREAGWKVRLIDFGFSWRMYFSC